MKSVCANHNAAAHRALFDNLMGPGTFSQWQAVGDSVNQFSSFQCLVNVLDGLLLGRFRHRIDDHEADGEIQEHHLVEGDCRLEILR